MATCTRASGAQTIKSVWNNTLFPEKRGQLENITCVQQLGMAKMPLINFSILVTDRESGKRTPAL